MPSLHNPLAIHELCGHFVKGPITLSHKNTLNIGEKRYQKPLNQLVKNKISNPENRLVLYKIISKQKWPLYHV